MKRPEAFILFGGLATAWWPLFMDTLVSSDLAVLVIDEPDPSVPPLLEQYRRQPDHPYSSIRECIQFEPQNHPAVLRQVASWQQRYHLRGVCCIWEPFVQVSGLVADFLHLPSPGLRATQVCRNKLLQRLYLREWSPACTPLHPQQREAVGASFDHFPAVLKPTGRSSSSGVQRISTREGLSDALQNYPAEELLLLEHLVVGREYSVETLVRHGRPFFAGITQKQTNEDEGRFFVELSHTVPATNLSPAEYERILQTNERVLARLGFEQGIAHAEYRLTEQGEVFLMEIAARNPGGSILTLYRLATGQALEPLIIDLALDRVTDQATYATPVRFARQCYLPHQPGTLRDVLVDPALGVSPLWLSHTHFWPAVAAGRKEERPTLRAVTAIKSRGIHLQPIESSADRAVTYLFDAATAGDLELFQDELQHAIEIVLEDPACEPARQ